MTTFSLDNSFNTALSNDYCRNPSVSSVLDMVYNNPAIDWLVCNLIRQVILQIYYVIEVRAVARPFQCSDFDILQIFLWFGASSIIRHKCSVSMNVHVNLVYLSDTYDYSCPFQDPENINHFFQDNLIGRAFN